MVSPNADFFAAAFGESYEEFLDILSMPDRYIVHREKYKQGQAKDWRKLFRGMTTSTRTEFLEVLARLNGIRDKKTEIEKESRFRELLEHYYPRGRVPPG